MNKQGCFCKACTNNSGIKIWKIFLVGVLLGYIWHYQATKYNIPRDLCTLNDVGIVQIPYPGKIDK